jgi:hypothetical protein
VDAGDQPVVVTLDDVAQKKAARRARKRTGNPYRRACANAWQTDQATIRCQRCIAAIRCRAFRVRASFVCGWALATAAQRAAASNTADCSTE